MNDLVVILASVMSISLIAFIGVLFVGLNEKILKRLLMAMVSFASGTLLGGALIHLLPEAVEMDHTITPFHYAILGVVVFFAMEKFLYWRHCHEGECPVHMFVYLNLFGDGLHNFIDGMIIAATYLISIDLGFATTLAVGFHEIPQEIGDFGVLIYGGFSKRKALAYNFVSAVTAILGALATYFLAYLQTIENLLVPFAAGGFIYIAAADLIPELHKRFRVRDSVVQLVAIMLGIGLMAYLRTMLHA
jgi:zinc and cadmium transporter